ncbi:MAG TPA: tRNA (N(6)-L-threonylcarbamoyladenosine(37)-C(2))-methylthiotransferase MtaB [Paludibacteraceae bacterium]|jgi:threonylcarbamoyladenosine tRNA methylthiotransferase MtaB|nr:tRNA (N(6)-L-threonylcarbamoyladenosine(37)-C(2))-methylthiotransferase MtaB [Paludibacteraceae bacterium]HPH63114.1 tRNA (N(6)-L-threonylcarbamoyladenosine(37)-C(2))-methylthiotransferase MtaB [Paludibacteraceae bacterium]
MIDQTIFKDKKVAFHTLGCKLNFAETSTIGQMLLENGFRKVKPGEVADVCLINTCSVTETADRKDRQAIKQMISKHPGAYIIVIGCYAQLKPEVVASIEGVDLVLGMQNKFDIVEHLASLNKESEAKVVHTARKDINIFFPSCTRGDRTRFFLKVQDGCDNFCSYCTVPIARGRSRNGSIADTVAQAKMAASEGAKEIVISGVNIGDFGKSTGNTFFDLVRELDKVEGIERYRISSIEPDLLTDEMIAFTAKSSKFVPHFHIPLQSGSDEVLALMKRHYKRDLFAAKIAAVKKVMPDAFIGVDVIVGTNGETEAYFEDAYQFIEGLDISQLHVFSYSERPNTQALKIEGRVSAKEKKRRSDLLHELSEKKRMAFYASHIGKDAVVLWEDKHSDGRMHGFTDNYLRVETDFDKSLVNTLTKVHLGDFTEDKQSLNCTF